MTTENVKRALDLIEERGDGDFEGPKEALLVVKAEKALGRSFPPSYKIFLLQLGCGDVGGFEVYGVIHDDFSGSGIPDAVWLTKKERVDAHLPEELVLVSEDGMGNYFALDTGQARTDGECPVVLWEPGRGVRETCADDFGVFLLNGVRNAS